MTKYTFYRATWFILKPPALKKCLVAIFFYMKNSFLCGWASRIKVQNLKESKQLQSQHRAENYILCESTCSMEFNVALNHHKGKINTKIGLVDLKFRAFQCSTKFNNAWTKSRNAKNINVILQYYACTHFAMLLYD